MSHLRCSLVMLCATLASVPPAALAADAAPYTDQAAWRLDRAAERVELKTPKSDDKIEHLKALVQFVDAVYAKAGYSFEKSYLRYLTEVKQTGGPPRHRAALGLGAPYVGTMAVSGECQRLSQVFRGETLRLSMDVCTDVAGREAKGKREEQEKSAAAEASKREGVEKRLQEVGALISGRYHMSNSSEHYVDLRWEQGSEVTVSGEFFEKTVDRTQLCRLPETKVTLTTYYESSKQLVGAGSGPGCRIDLTAAEGTVSLLLGYGSSGCSQPCSVGKWTGGTYASDEVTRRFAERAREQREAALTPQQRQLQEEAEGRSRQATGQTAQSPKKSSSTATKTEDPAKVIQDAAKALEGLFKRR